MEEPLPGDPTQEDIEKAKKRFRKRHLKVMRGRKGTYIPYQPKIYKVVSARGKGMIE